jgi:hypothetical protein
VISRAYSLARSLLLLAIVGYLSWRIGSGWPAIRDLTFDWHGPTLVGAVVSGLLAYQFLFFGWLILLWRSDYFEARHLPAYGHIWWVSYLYRYVPGKLLLVVERARMGPAVGIPPAVGATLAVVETLLAMVAAAWLSLLAVSFYAGDQARIVWMIGLLSLAGVALLPVGSRWILSRPILMKRYPELARAAVQPSSIVWALPAFALFYVFQGLSFFLWARSLQPFPWSDLPGFCGIYAMSHLLGLVTMIAPGGLGVREGALAIQLARTFAAGVAEAVAVGLRLWFTLVELISFGVAMLVSPRLPDAPVASATAEPEARS